MLSVVCLPRTILFVGFRGVDKSTFVICAKLFRDGTDVQLDNLGCLQMSLCLDGFVLSASVTTVGSS